MPNYKLLIEYDGRKFEGWQKQKATSNTIQETIESAISQVLRSPEIRLTGAGRTDAGVSAYEQAANFSAETEIDTGKFVHSVNSVLPKDITVLDAVEVSNDFHSRYSAIAREYSYRCTTKRKSINSDQYYHVRHDPDFDKMQQFIGHVLTLKNFRTFCKNKDDKHNFACNVINFEITKSCDTEFEFRIIADRFLHSMVRALVGCCLDLSRGRFSLEDIVRASERGDKINLYFVPPEPLSLIKIHYRNEN